MPSGGTAHASPRTWISEGLLRSWSGIDQEPQEGPYPWAPPISGRFVCSGVGHSDSHGRLAPRAGREEGVSDGFLRDKLNGNKYHIFQCFYVVLPHVIIIIDSAVRNDHALPAALPLDNRCVIPTDPHRLSFCRPGVCLQAPGVCLKPGNPHIQSIKDLYRSRLLIQNNRGN